jgi:hypothetical protein
MNEVIDFFSNNTTLAYITAVVIFIVTVYLLIRRLIGFMVTLLLLAFALASGLAIANYDLFREVLSSFKYDASKTKEDQYSHFKTQLNKAYEELKEEFQDQKKKIEAMYDAYSSSKAEPKEEVKK